MSEYNLQFKDLKEGKVYRTKQTLSEYTLKDGLLYIEKLGYYSILSQQDIFEIRFKEIIQLPENFKKLMKLLPDNYKWIVKDDSGEVWVYTHKPQRLNGYYDDGSGTQSMEITHYDIDYSFIDYMECKKIADLLKGEI